MADIIQTTVLISNKFIVPVYKFPCNPHGHERVLKEEEVLKFYPIIIGMLYWYSFNNENKHVINAFPCPFLAKPSPCLFSLLMLYSVA